MTQGTMSPINSQVQRPRLPRNATLDYARLIAALGIVYFHSGAPGAALGHAALPFFLIVLIVLARPVAQRSTFSSFALSRWRRLIQPWLYWSAIYATFKLAELAVTDLPMASEFAPWMFLTGPALHLWFLPFAFAACLLAFPLLRLQSVPAFVLPGLVVASVALLSPDQQRSWPVPLAQWFHVFPALILGIGFALAQSPRSRLLALAAFVVIAVLIGWTSSLVQTTLAALAVIGCLSLEMPSTRASALSAETALGVYLCHPLILSGLQRLTDIPPKTVEFAVAAMAGALMASIAIHLATSSFPRPIRDRRPADRRSAIRTNTKS